MTLSSLTKAQLVLKVREAQNAQVHERQAAEALRAEVEQVRAELAETNGQLAEALYQPKVPEADALAGCVRALECMPKTEPRLSYSVGERTPDRAAVQRVLVHLADRYGVDLIERTTEPCSRAHLDELPHVSIADALGAVMGR